MSRHLGADYSVITVVMIRYWFFAAFVVALAAAQKGGIAPGGRAPRGSGCRSSAACCSRSRSASTVLSFVLLGLIGTHAIFAVYPLLVAALAGPVLGEYVGWRRGLAIAVGLARHAGDPAPRLPGVQPAGAGPLRRRAALRALRAPDPPGRPRRQRRDQPLLHRRRRRGGDHPRRRRSSGRRSRAAVDWFWMAGALRLRRRSGTS